MGGRTQQLRIKFLCGWGGKRKRAGRKRRGRKMVGHRTRERLASRYPVHVTVRVRDEVGRLRRWKVATELKVAFQRCCAKEDFRICQFSMQNNHLHLICEAKDADALARGVGGWEVSMARRINRLKRRRGHVFADRYHVEILRTPRQVRNALCYVMQNARRHGLAPRGNRRWVDPFSSARYFDGWAEYPCLEPPDPGEKRPVAAAQTFLLQELWRRWGLIGLGEVPPAAARN